jgi:hypothetical protein
MMRVFRTGQRNTKAVPEVEATGVLIDRSYPAATVHACYCGDRTAAFAPAKPWLGPFRSLVGLSPQSRKGRHHGLSRLVPSRARNAATLNLGTVTSLCQSSGKDIRHTNGGCLLRPLVLWRAILCGLASCFALQALTPYAAPQPQSPRPLGVVRAGPRAKRGGKLSRSGVAAVISSACRWWLAGLCCLSAPSTGLAEPTESQFSAQGHIVATNSLGFRGQYDFRVTVQGDRWLIESFTPGSSRRVIEVGSTGDGTILRVEHSPDGKGSFAIIESNTVPADAGGLAPLLYTFFCQSAQLAGNQAGFLIPAYDPEAGVLFKPAARRFARWKKWDQGHTFFRWLAFYSSPVGSEDGSMLQDEVGDGCIAKFVILSMTNWNHRDLPCSGEYFRFQPPGTPLPTLAYSSFTVESVSAPTNSAMAPSLPEGQPFTIVDRRLLGSSASNPVMCYVSTQPSWPSLARARHLFALQQGARRAPSKGSLPHQAVLCGFAILPIIAFAFLVWHARAARNSPNIKKYHASTTT